MVGGVEQNALERNTDRQALQHHEAASVYRTEPHSLDELEAAAARLRIASRVTRKQQVSRRSRTPSDLLLGDGFSRAGYHPSGAIVVKAGLAPMEHLIGEKADKKALTEASVATAALGSIPSGGPAKTRVRRAAVADSRPPGMNRDRVRGRESYAAIGAFRRYHGRPARLGSRSVVVELPAETRSRVGVDWRRCRCETHRSREGPRSRARGACQIVADLNGRLPGGGLATRTSKSPCSARLHLAAKRRVQAPRAGITSPCGASRLVYDEPRRGGQR